MDLFLPVRFRTQVQLSPYGITGSIDEHLHDKISGMLEGICSRFGYIRPGSIEIIKRSVGMLMKAHFNGHIKYDVICKADICNPVRGMVFKTVVKKKNDLGLLAEGSIVIDGNSVPILDVVIPKRSAGITSEIDLEEVNNGDEIFVEVLGKRYQLNDRKIEIIARAVKEPQKKKLRDGQEISTEDGLEDLQIDGGVEDYDGSGGTDSDDAGSEGDSEGEDDDGDGDGVSDDDNNTNHAKKSGRSDSDSDGVSSEGIPSDDDLQDYEDGGDDDLGDDAVGGGIDYIDDDNF